jgi:S-DNA-T family DNA segregation ATPase FtsK/SpoIIIE
MRPFVMGRELSPMEHRLVRSPDPTAGNGAKRDPADRVELKEFVAVMSEAAALFEPAADFHVCPDPLPDDIPMQSFLDAHPGDGVPLALIDLPDEQRQEPLWWRPDLGAFVAIGAAGSGRTTLLVSLALGIATRFSADDVHLYCIDADTGALDPLSQLPHVGGVSHLADIDGVVQLVQMLSREVDRRNGLADALGGTRRVAEVEPSIVLMVDDIGRLRHALESTATPENSWSAFERLMAEGQSLGLCLVVTANEPSELPSSIAAPTASQIILGLDDQSGSERPGIDDANVMSGRGRRRDDGVELQLVMPPDDIAAAVAELDVEAPTERPPMKLAR